MKTCSKCKQQLPFSSFTKNEKRKDGFHHRCKSCSTALKKQSRNKNPLKLLLTKAKTRAKRFNREFTITEKDFLVLPLVCPVLGIQMYWGNADGDTRDGSPSLDRIDSSKGYIPGNVLIISFRANTLKRDATIEELCKMADFYRNIYGRASTY